MFSVMRELMHPDSEVPVNHCRRRLSYGGSTGLAGVLFWFCKRSKPLNYFVKKVEQHFTRMRGETRAASQSPLETSAVP